MIFRLRVVLRAGLQIACLLACSAALAAARDVNVPIRLDHDFVRQGLMAQVYSDPGGKAKLWDDGTGCGFLTLWDPQVDSVNGRLRITSHGEAQVGTPMGDICLAPVQWKGLIEVFEVPVLSDDRQVLQFRVVESNLLGPDRRKGLFTGKIWDLVKEHVQPRFQALRFDLHAGMQDLRELLPLMIRNDDAPRIEAMLASVRVREAEVASTGISVAVGFTLGLSDTPLAPTAEPTLTPEEIERWQAAWQRWDGFLTFVVKIFGKDIPAGDVQLALREVLLEARFDILDALAPQPGVPDPTRALFLKTWARLAPVVRASAASLPGATGLRYLSFIAAGDALAALDQAGPDIGLDISGDGLRRLARVVAPAATEDPLTYSLDVDPELRRLFGFSAALAPPDLSGMPSDEPAGAGADEAEEAAPTPSSWLRLPWQPALVYAATEPSSAQAVLARWIVERDNLDTYLQAVREVLLEAMNGILQRSDLAPGYRDVYRKLVLTTAWKESCWRQFLRAKGRVTYIASPVGATGMMQVFEKVWRGVYDVQGLRWDIRYNARAGAEILLHYISDYAIAKKEDQQPGGIDNLARATYAVYNGGPGHLSRYRRKDTKPALKKIDELFWEKYRVVGAGQELEVGKCLVGG